MLSFQAKVLSFIIYGLLILFASASLGGTKLIYEYWKQDFNPYFLVPDENI